MMTDADPSKSILFVDGEQYVRKALKRSLRDMRGQWAMHFAGEPGEALQIMARGTVDVLITEMVFAGGPGGLEFLGIVRDHHPNTVRIILSGYVDRDITLQTVDLAHQFLAKPCDDDDLKGTIARAFLVRDLLRHEPLKRLTARIDSLPSLPALYAELVEALASEESSVQQVGAIIAKDPGLTAKILKVVNSSFFGLPQKVSTPDKAVGLLGLDLVQTIVLASGTFDKFEKVRLRGFSIEQMWDHAMATALMAKIIAREARLDPTEVDTAFMAGLLHDIGKLIVAANMPDDYHAVVAYMVANDCGMASAEHRIIGTTHAAIGAYLLGLWGLPDPIIQAVARHHTPGTSSSQGLAADGITHIADAFANAGCHLGGTVAQDSRLDWTFVERAGLTGTIDAWQALCARTSDV
jgi:putative nucleotidyltransferase with HDIG domain